MTVFISHTHTTHTLGEITMSNEKSPYELRFDLLHLARSIIQENKDKKFHLLMKEKETNPNAKYEEKDLLISFDDVVEKAKELNKFIKGLGIKGVQSQTQGDQVRVISKKRDDLQTVITKMKEADFELPLH